MLVFERMHAEHPSVKDFRCAAAEKGERFLLLHFMDMRTALAQPLIDAAQAAAKQDSVVDLRRQDVRLSVRLVRTVGGRRRSGGSLGFRAGERDPVPFPHAGKQGYKNRCESKI